MFGDLGFSEFEESTPDYGGHTSAVTQDAYAAAACVDATFYAAIEMVRHRIVVVPVGKHQNKDA
jgi:hypothetical protein